MGGKITVNTRLKEVRLLYGLSQGDFGKRIGIESRSHISALEKGRRVITDRVINDVCREFNINEQWLRSGKGEKLTVKTDDYVKISVDIDKHDPKARKAIIDYWHLNAQDKELFWNFINRFFHNEKKDGGAS